jgi:hypothetical protein
LRKKNCDVDKDGLVYGRRPPSPAVFPDVDDGNEKQQQQAAVFFRATTAPVVDEQ